MASHIFRTRLIIAIALLGLCTCASAARKGSATVQPVNDRSYTPVPVVLIVDGKVVSAESMQFIRGQQVMVWLRDLEALGWGTTSAGDPGEVIFKGGGVTLSFTKGAGVARVNSLAVQLPVDVYVRDGRMMVPLSFVAKALGYEYEVAYKPVASIITNPVKVVQANNVIQGRVFFAGRGIAGITVRAVDRDFNVIKDAVAVTDSSGSYRIDGLPDGDFAAYVYTGDNPTYFNRASDAATVKGGQVGTLKPIALGRILAPITPNPGTTVSDIDGWVNFKWAPCEDAASYELVIRKKGSESETLTINSDQPKARVSASKLKSGTAYEVQVSAIDANGEYVGGIAGVGKEPWGFTFRRKTAKP
ncbi:hypothetical protein LLG39_04005 [bacterium]|nr:hypothetical protein [bacterium]